MEINLTPNKNLFLIFLLINAAGYDYENNPKGERETRKRFRKKAKQLVNQYSEIQEFIKIIQKTKIPNSEYVRLANLIMLSKNSTNLPKDISSQIKHQFDEVSKLEVITNLFREYTKDVENTLNNLKANCFDEELNKTLNFFNLSEENIKINLQIHLNLLESYCRGTNYFDDNNQIISTSLDFDEKISWQTVRHEFMHILLKSVFKNNLKDIDIEIPVDQDYSQDDLRVKFDENFILAANLFFIDEQEKRDCNLKYFYDRGYGKIHKFYSLIEEYFVKSKSKLSDEILNEFARKIA